MKTTQRFAWMQMAMAIATPAVEEAIAMTRTPTFIPGFSNLAMPPAIWIVAPPHHAQLAPDVMLQVAPAYQSCLLYTSDA
ncbi:MAG: hypothetical protein N2515_09105, partial [Deltaproteobacteria bacterium]|nr:hypothetical protein [Deltaproteobacteria bacterium]